MKNEGLKAFWADLKSFKSFNLHVPCFQLLPPSVVVNV